MINEPSVASTGKIYSYSKSQTNLLIALQEFKSKSVKKRSLNVPPAPSKMDEAITLQQ